MPSISPPALVWPLSRAAFAVALAFSGTIAIADDLAPKADERQLAHAMHSEMSERPSISVGRAAPADIIGTDERALQAAVDYVAGLGGGLVEIGEGEFLMRDSLHLRSGVTVRGRKGKTILRKADAATSVLALDGDFGEQQITLKEPAGFRPGMGVAIWDDKAGGFRDTRAGAQRTQTVGIRVEDRVGPVEIGANRIEASPIVDDRRREGPKSGPPK